MIWRVRKRSVRSERVRFACQARLALAVGLCASMAGPVTAAAQTQPARIGLALRAARQVAERGDFEAADARFAAVARSHPEVADHADLLRLRMLIDAGRPAEAVAVGERALRAHAESPALARLLRALGDAYLSVGAEPAARSVWELALEKSPPSDERAEILLALAQSFLRAGRNGDAEKTYRKLWRAHPDRPEAELAELGLGDLGRRVGVSLIRGTDWFERAQVLYRLRRHEDALDAYDRALRGRLSSAQRRRAKDRRAHTLFRMRDYRAAAQAFGSLGREPGARIERARSLARAGDTQAAVRTLESLARRLRGRHAERARHLAALLLASGSSEKRAQRHFAHLAQSARDRSIRRDARWRLAWMAYERGRLDEALHHLHDLEAATRDPIDRLRPRYWRARTLEHEADPRAEGLFAAIVAEYPLTYYGWRARARLEPRSIPVLERRGPRSGPARLRPSRIGRLQALLVAGLATEAREEISTLSRSRLSLQDRLELAQLASDAGDAHRAQRLLVDPYVEELARGPRAGAEELWWLAWPRVYPEAVAAEGGEVDSELVYAIMREESGYRAEVVSVVGARGLMQIMPDTASRLAADLTLSRFQPDDLFDPVVNVRLGIHYLGQLCGQFDGRVSAAIGSYNAGPTAVRRWLEARGSLEDDEWVESIPYAQTRAYVKRVLRSLHAYQVLY